MASTLAEISEACLKQLEHEEAALRRALDGLTVVRTALLQADSAALLRLTERQQAAARSSLALRGSREALRRRMAAALGIDESTATLERLVLRLDGPQGDRLRAAAERVRGLALEVDDLNRRNAGVVNHCLNFTRRFLTEITGGGTAERYGPTGAHLEAACGSLLSARG